MDTIPEGVKKGTTKSANRAQSAPQSPRKCFTAPQPLVGLIDGCENETSKRTVKTERLEVRCYGFIYFCTYSMIKGKENPCFKTHVL